MKKTNNKSFTQHGYYRLKERTNINDKELKRINYYAIKNGIGFSDIPSGPLKDYVARRVFKKNKKVKLYRDYVFIFFKNSKRMITCYKIPDKYLEEYKKILKKKNN